MWKTSPASQSQMMFYIQACHENYDKSKYVSKLCIIKYNDTVSNSRRGLTMYLQ